MSLRGPGRIGGADTSVVVAPVTQVDTSRHIRTNTQAVNGNSMFGDSYAAAFKLF